MELLLPLSKKLSLPLIAQCTVCTHGEQGSQDFHCTRPVKACRLTHLMQSSEAILSRNRSSWNKSHSTYILYTLANH